MHHIQVLGCASPLFDSLASWRGRVATFAQSTFDALPEAIERIGAQRPEWVVYCGAVAHSTWDDRDAVDPDELNRVRQVAQAASDSGSRLAVISSDRVFAGPRMFHEEGEPPSSDATAQQLVSLEQAAIDFAPQRVLIVRTHTIGWTKSGDRFAERIWHALDCGRSIEMSTNSFATPILATDLADLLLRAFRARLHGILHLAGAERTSPFRFAGELAMSAGFDACLVRPKDSEACEVNGDRASETSLGSRLARRELGVSLPLLCETVEKFIDQATSGYRDRLRGAETMPARAA